MKSQKIFLLDAFALIYRSYFAFSKNPRITSKGFNTSAIYGFTTTLLDVIKKHNPTHLVVAFDLKEPTLRHIEYPEYKANREAMPEDIESAIPYIQQLLDAFNVSRIGVAGYEADDVIGTLAKQAKANGFSAVMMTPNKDYAQLVEEDIYLYRPGRFGKPAEMMGVDEVCKKFKVADPDQVIDLLGMMGDKVDNIPGIPGVGEKTAQGFIEKYGSVEGLYDNLDRLKGKLKEKVENNKELAFLSKKLVTIDINVPMEYSFDDFKFHDRNDEKLKELFAELEFKTLSQKLFGESISSAASSNSSAPAELFAEGEIESIFKTIKDIDHNYKLVNDDASFAELKKEITESQLICFDTETDGLDHEDNKAIGVALSVKKHEAFYLPFDENTNSYCQELVKILSDDSKIKIAHNVKFDMAMMRNAGYSITGPFYDTMLAHYILAADERHGMDKLSEKYLKYQPISIESILGKKGKSQKLMTDIPVDQMYEYAAEDADVTLQLYHVLEEKLDAEEKKLLNEIELPLVEVLFDMEHEGIRMDVEAMKEFSKELEQRQKELETSIHEHAGKSFSISSPKQLGEVLFEDLKILEKPKKTKTGQYATGEDILEKLTEHHPIVTEILEYRQVSKLKSTYVDALPKLVKPKTGRIHTTYRQSVASTGRLSSDNPNLQNIPIRTEQGRKVRAAFVARDENHVLLAADYSQVELRIMADLAQDANMLNDFKTGVDIHSATASRVFGVDINEVDRELRSKAKAVNFGIIYGQSAFGLSQQLNIKRGEAKEIIDAYFEKYASIKDYIESQKTLAKEKGYVKTIMGRKRWLSDINSRNATVRSFAERNAINAPIQGSAADIIKKAMIDIQEWLKSSKYQTKMLLQVHDELVFDVPKNELDEVMPIIKEKMESANPLSVPMEVECGVGDNWLEAH